MDEAAPDALRRRRLTLLLAPIVVLVIASNVGAALAPTLVNDHPLLLIALNAQNRHLVGVANQLDAVSYYVVGSLRLLLSDPLFYLLGWWYGDAAVAWIEKKSSGTGNFLRAAERYFSKAGYILVFVAPNNYICLFAGASRMPPWAFMAVNAAGTVSRLIALRVVGDIFQAPIDDVLDFLARYRWQATAVTVAIVALQIANDRRKGTSEIEAIGQLEREIEDQIDEVEERRHADDG